MRKKKPCLIGLCKDTQTDTQKTNCNVIHNCTRVLIGTWRGALPSTDFVRSDFQNTRFKWGGDNTLSSPHLRLVLVVGRGFGWSPGNALAPCLPFEKSRGSIPRIVKTRSFISTANIPTGYFLSSDWPSSFMGSRYLMWDNVRVYPCLILSSHAQNEHSFVLKIASKIRFADESKIANSTCFFSKMKVCLHSKFSSHHERPPPVLKLFFIMVRVLISTYL